MGAWRLRLFYFVYFSALGLYLPLFPRWLEAHAGGESTRRGLAILVLVPVAELLSPVAVGTLADRLGLRSGLVRIAAAVAGLATVALTFIALSPSLAELRVVLLSVFLFLFALARSPIAGLADVLAQEHAARRPDQPFSSLRVWGSIGFAASALVFPWIGDVAAPLDLPLAIAVSLGLTLASSFLLPSKAAPVAGANLGALFGLRSHAVFFGAIFAWQVGNSAYDGLFGFLLHSRGVKDASTGFFWAFGVGAEIVAMWFMPSIVRRFAARSLLTFGLSVSGIRWLLVAWTSSPMGLFALQGLHAITFALTWLVAMAWLLELDPGEAKPLGMLRGAVSAAVSLGSLTGMMLWSSLEPIVGLSGCFAIAGAAPLVGAVAVASKRRSPSTAKQQTA